MTDENKKHHFEITLSISYDGAPVAMETRTVPALAIDDTSQLEPEFLGDLEGVDLEDLFQN